MTCIIHYSNESGNHIYTLKAPTSQEARENLQSFLAENNLKEDQITIEMINAN